MRKSPKKKRPPCRKVAHRDAKEANFAKHKLERKGATGLYAYICPYCRKWHVGHDKFRS